MKKIAFALVGMLASTGLVIADDSDKIIDSQDVYEENSADDGWTGVYGSLGLGWEWMENKGTYDYMNGDTDPKKETGSMNKQKNNRFCGTIGLGGQMLFAQHFLAGLEVDCTFAKSEDKNAELILEDGKEKFPNGDQFHVKNKGVSPAIYAKLGYVFCNKHVVYTKLGVKWLKTRIEDMRKDTGGDESFDSNKGVFAAALGYQCAFTKNVSGFAEVNYAGRNKVDHGGINEIQSISLKTNDSNWGFSAGVSVRFPMN